mmetsp:Transcript_3965/g.8488  ORF Transcript_3965/g.8488 Transcript_3965/m.8488 type:complete len:82 (+) Transcript_3965:1732-1977(+)
MIVFSASLHQTQVHRSISRAKIPLALPRYFAGVSPILGLLEIRAALRSKGPGSSRFPSLNGGAVGFADDGWLIDEPTQAPS